MLNNNLCSIPVFSGSQIDLDGVIGKVELFRSVADKIANIAYNNANVCFLVQGEINCFKLCQSDFYTFPVNIIPVNIKKENLFLNAEFTLRRDVVDAMVNIFDALRVGLWFHPNLYVDDNFPKLVDVNLILESILEKK